MISMISQVAADVGNQFQSLQGFPIDFDFLLKKRQKFTPRFQSLKGFPIDFDVRAGYIQAVSIIVSIPKRVSN